MIMDGKREVDLVVGSGTAHGTPTAKIGPFSEGSDVRLLCRSEGGLLLSHINFFPFFLTHD